MKAKECKWKKKIKVIAKADINDIPSDLGKKRLIASSIYTPAFRKIKQFSEC